MKKGLAVLLSLVMLFALLPATASADGKDLEMEIKGLAMCLPWPTITGNFLSHFSVSKFKVLGIF